VNASVELFSWVHGARYYVDVHRRAVGLVEPDHRPAGRRWLDVGCGRGLVARLAAERGFEVVGIDRDAAMVARAEAMHRRVPSLRFQTGELDDVRPHSASVVSAASLLCVLDDPTDGLIRLWNAVEPGGSLLVVETTPKMTARYALTHLPRLPAGRRTSLLLWAAARTAAVDPTAFDRLPAANRSTVPLLAGMVAATVIARPATEVPRVGGRSRARRESLPTGFQR
jgi:SAM-dependent methyltransferase